MLRKREAPSYFTDTDDNIIWNIPYYTIKHPREQNIKCSFDHPSPATYIRNHNNQLMSYLNDEQDDTTEEKKRLKKLRKILKFLIKERNLKFSNVSHEIDINKELQKDQFNKEKDIAELDIDGVFSKIEKYVEKNLSEMPLQQLYKLVVKLNKSNQALMMVMSENKEQYRNIPSIKNSTPINSKITQEKFIGYNLWKNGIWNNESTANAFINTFTTKSTANQNSETMEFNLKLQENATIKSPIITQTSQEEENKDLARINTRSSARVSYTNQNLSTFSPGGNPKISDNPKSSVYSKDSNNMNNRGLSQQIFSNLKMVLEDLQGNLSEFPKNEQKREYQYMKGFFINLKYTISKDYEVNDDIYLETLDFDLDSFLNYYIKDMLCDKKIYISLNEQDCIDHIKFSFKKQILDQYEMIKFIKQNLELILHFDEKVLLDSNYISEIQNEHYITINLNFTTENSTRNLLLSKLEKTECEVEQLLQEYDDEAIVEILKLEGFTEKESAQIQVDLKQSSNVKQNFVDSFEWDLLNKFNDPEDFALVYMKDHKLCDEQKLIVQKTILSEIQEYLVRRCEKILDFVDIFLKHELLHDPSQKNNTITKIEDEDFQPYDPEFPEDTANQKNKTKAYNIEDAIKNSDYQKYNEMLDKNLKWNNILEMIGDETNLYIPDLDSFKGQDVKNNFKNQDLLQLFQNNSALIDPEILEQLDI